MTHDVRKLDIEKDWNVYILKMPKPGTYRMTALFMNIKDSDGGPIRAIL